MSEERIEYLFSNLKDFMIEKFDQLEKRFDEHEKQQKIDFENLEKRMDKRFKEHEKQQKIDFENLEKRIDKRFKEHEKQQEIDMKQLEERIMKRFDEHEEKQRLDFARLEHVMYERTSALFDAREVSLDGDENLYKKFKSLERVLDKHHYRITELESKIS